MAKTDFLTADMTRRQFMKISGKSLAGLSLSASITSTAVTNVVNNSYFYVTEVLSAE